MDTTRIRSKSWDICRIRRSADTFCDYCLDSAAGEVCPVWPGQPISAHWSFQDPASYQGSESQKRACFREIFRQIRTRIDLLHALPLTRLDRLAIRRELKPSATPMSDFPRRLAAEALGTMLLLAAVVGSGIMAERLTQDVALALLCNTLATGAILFVLIVIFAPVSGAHFNPAVTLVMLLDRRIKPLHAGAYIPVQICGAIVGVLLAHAMFGITIFAWGIKSRTGSDSGCPKQSLCLVWC